MRCTTALIALLLCVATASAAGVDLAGWEGIFSQFGIDAFGSLVIIGLIFFVILIIWLVVGRYGLRATLLALFVYFEIVADPTTGAGLLPSWTFVLILILAGLFTYLAGTKLMNRGG